MFAPPANRAFSFTIRTILTRWSERQGYITPLVISWRLVPTIAYEERNMLSLTRTKALVALYGNVSLFCKENKPC